MCLGCCVRAPDRRGPCRSLRFCPAHRSQAVKQLIESFYAEIKSTRTYNEVASFFSSGGAGDGAPAAAAADDGRVLFAEYKAW